MVSFHVLTHINIHILNTLLSTSDEDFEERSDFLTL